MIFFFQIAKSCIKLIELDISYCGITTDGLLPVIEHCTQLKQLNISGCKKVSLKLSLDIFNSYIPCTKKQAAATLFVKTACHGKVVIGSVSV